MLLHPNGRLFIASKKKLQLKFLYQGLTHINGLKFTKLH